MNLILFQNNEWKFPLPREDSRCIHIKSILKAGSGDLLDAGIIGGTMGKAMIKKLGSDGSILFDYFPETQAPPLCPLTLIIGIPRPPTAKRLIRDLTASGVERIMFTGTDLGEKSYLTSRLWTKGEWEEAVLSGMSQGKSSIQPEVLKFYSLYKSIDTLELLHKGWDRAVLDNREQALPLKNFIPRAKHCCLALGPERGWSDRERGILNDRGFTLCSLGKRVLRTETAAHMGTALMQGILDFI